MSKHRVDDPIQASFACQRTRAGLNDLLIHTDTDKT